MSRRSCVSEGDIVVLGEMLRDKDRITRMATASVLTDFGPDGRRVVQTRLAEVEDVSEKLMLQDALDAAAKPDYRPILQYPLTDAERRHIHGCGHKVSAEVTRPTIPHYDGGRRHRVNTLKSGL